MPLGGPGLGVITTTEASNWATKVTVLSLAMASDGGSTLHWSPVWMRRTVQAVPLPPAVTAFTGAAAAVGVAVGALVAQPTKTISAKPPSHVDPFRMSPSSSIVSEEAVYPEPAANCQ